MFLDMKVTTPTIDKQHEAVTVFEKSGVVEPLQHRMQRELDALPPLILDKAFKGEL